MSLGSFQNRTGIMSSRYGHSIKPLVGTTSSRGKNLIHSSQQCPQPTSHDDDDEFSDFQSGLPTSKYSRPLFSTTNSMTYTFSPLHQHQHRYQSQKGNEPHLQNEVGSRLANYGLSLTKKESEQKYRKESKTEAPLIGDEDKYSPFRTLLHNEYQNNQNSQVEEDDFGDFQCGIQLTKEAFPSLPSPLPAVSPSPSVGTVLTPLPKLVPAPVQNVPIIESRNQISEADSTVDEFGDFMGFSTVLKQSEIPNRMQRKVDLTDVFGLGVSPTQASPSSPPSFEQLNKTKAEAMLTGDIVEAVKNARQESFSVPTVTSFSFDGLLPLKTTLISGPSASVGCSLDPFDELLTVTATAPVELKPSFPHPSVSAIDFKSKGKNSPETQSISSLDLGRYDITLDVSEPTLKPESESFTLASERTHKECNQHLPSDETRDKYSVFRQEEDRETEKCVREWRRCMDICVRIMEEAEGIFHSVPSSDVFREVIETEKGRTYILSLREIYLVACRVYQSWMRMGGNEVLGELHQRLALAWDSISPFLVGTNLEEYCSRDGSPNSGHDNDKACGICLVGTGGDDGVEELWRLSLDFGGTLYHLPCANFWINEVDSTLPSLTNLGKYGILI